MAECHPVGFGWVIEAKARGATVIHVDPRFTRTSAVADLYVPLRAGSDIVLLGALINYVLTNGLDFREYVVAYTNAAAILREDFRDTEDLDGLFSGFVPDGPHYDHTTWGYEGAEAAAAATADREHEGDAPDQAAQHGGPEHRATSRADTYGSGGAAVGAKPRLDQTLQHPRCVYQVLKRHFARYTPEMVADVCGVPPEVFARVAEAVTANSGRDRTTAFVYSVGWTQHSVGAQYIRTASILQALLGNIGRPGGGILALRGHASIPGSTDIPTLYDILPGYLSMPRGDGSEETLRDYLAHQTKPTRLWNNFPAYFISLLKAYYGKNATAENDFGYSWVPKITGNHSFFEYLYDMADGKMEGMFIMGQNPAVAAP